MNHVDLDAIELKQGSHNRREDGVCAMEAVAWLADEPHSDHPECASKVLGHFMRTWNDQLNDEGRQRLKPYLPKLVGTVASDEVEETRAWMAADWLVRVHTPAWLRLAGVTEAAEALEGLPELRDLDALRGARPAIDRANGDARAAWDAARDAARAAARAAARDAAWDAAWDAARAAAWAAAWAAARDAARAAAWAAAWAAARDAARAAARAAAWDAGYTAAKEAATKVLEPTKTSLQTSAFELLDRMIAVEAHEEVSA